MNQVTREHGIETGKVLQLVEGDLTQETTDAIVNAANEDLIHGGGVAGAISRKGGDQIQAESDSWVQKHGPVTHAKPAYTRAGSLPCRYIIHAVGPVWGEGQEDANLAVAIRGSLQLAARLDLASISFPAISTGIFGFPKMRAARLILTTILEYFHDTPATPLQTVRLVIFDPPTLDAFLAAWEEKGLEAG